MRRGRASGRSRAKSVGRPLSLRVAAALLVAIGASGLLVGLELLAVERRATFDVGPAALAIPAGIGAYGVAALAGGIGLWLRRRWAHRLALATISVGLLELAWQETLLGFDPVTSFGLGLWGLVLVLLLLPGVRSAVSRR